MEALVIGQEEDVVAQEEATTSAVLGIAQLSAVTDTVEEGALSDSGNRPTAAAISSSVVVGPEGPMGHEEGAPTIVPAAIPEVGGPMVGPMTTQSPIRVSGPRSILGEAMQQSKAENNDKFSKGRQYTKRKLRNKKAVITNNHTFDKLQLSTLDQDDDCHHKPDGPSSTPPKRVLELILDTLQRRDVHQIFAEPVDPNEVKDYYEIITHPMDFGTMRTKLQQGMYQSLDQFEHDVLLIFKNAMQFNSSTTVYYKQARDLNDMAVKLFHELRTDQHKFERELDTTKRRRFATKIHSADADSNLESLPKLQSHKRKGLPLIDLDMREDPLCKTIYPESTPLVYVSQQDMSYKESLMEFAKDLGPTARRVAQRKLQESAASKCSQEIIKIADDNSKIQNAPCGMTRRRRRGQFNDKQIVLGVPAFKTARRRKNSTAKTTMDSVENKEKKMKKEAQVKSLANDKCNHSGDHMKQETQEKGAMKPPSWQLNKRFDLNQAVSMPGSCTAAQLFKTPRHNPFGMAATNSVTSGAGYGHQVGSSASSIGRDIYFNKTYLRSKFNGATDTCKIPK